MSQGRGDEAPGGPAPAARQARREDLQGILDLLREAGLPAAGAADHLDTFWVLEPGGGTGLVGVAGLELYGPYALLRSVAVALEWRGRGLGRRLADLALGEAAGRGCREVFLLTVTAEEYFARLGFEPRPRESLPRELGASAELQGACPVTAVAMARGLARL